VTTSITIAAFRISPRRPSSAENFPVIFARTAPLTQSAARITSVRSAAGIEHPHRDHG
jgi:hypothetical protein